MIEVMSGGVLNTVQDLGRPGWLRAGVSLGGAMDRPALDAANRLLGNAPGAAGLEIQLFPFRLRAHGETAIAVTGADSEAAVDGVTLPPWWATPLRPGQTLTLAPPRTGARAYLAFAGGIDVPNVLGSRSTDVRGRFGGLDGQGLARGARLILGPAPAWPAVLASGVGTAPPNRAGRATDKVRVLPAAEYQGFSAASKVALEQGSWTVTNEANRMGYRLSGPNLALDHPVELFSHWVVPGTIQVPPAGQPIIQLSDANTCGGYPKIATVIEADLWCLAQAPVGTTLRFEVVDQDTAVAALREQARWLADLSATRAAFGATG